MQTWRSNDAQVALMFSNLPLTFCAGDAPHRRIGLGALVGRVGARHDHVHGGGIEQEAAAVRHAQSPEPVLFVGFKGGQRRLREERTPWISAGLERSSSFSEPACGSGQTIERRRRPGRSYLPAPPLTAGSWTLW